MDILAVCGSPHRDGLTAQLTREAAKGAEEAGANVEIVLLTQHRVKPCRDCSNAVCWEEMECNIRDDDGLELRQRMNECKALIVCAPVYFLSVNGLTKDFIDRMRYYGGGGKPALPISVAGGTGKGCVFALQEICRWLVMLGFHPIMPLPVSRYDFEISLAEARQRGKRLVEQIGQIDPFANLAEKLAWYESLPFIRWGVAEEILHLAYAAINAICNRGRADLAFEPRAKLEQAQVLIRAGRIDEGLEKAVDAQEESMAIFNSLTYSEMC
ncbi:MAG: flavodoxin family protein [Actinobacteria bacterium]|nr:flavodoxin family protein [Actinomycetota bacterium]MCL5986903.1 flavodoxin family protein [Actinomycetota bacterium]